MSGASALTQRTEFGRPLVKVDILDTYALVHFDTNAPRMVEEQLVELVTLDLPSIGRAVAKLGKSDVPFLGTPEEIGAPLGLEAMRGNPFSRAPRRSRIGAIAGNIDSPMW